jgi:peptidoglycan-associated lipoprotein
MTVRRSCLTLAALAILAAPALGCAENKAAVPPAVTPLPGTKEPGGPNDAANAGSAANTANAGVETNGLHVSDAIARACGLPRTESAPRFDFDSTTIAPEDRDLLAAIARCVVDGALRGQSLALVGRADPRGEDEYNMSLGESRADTVQRYLHDLGVRPDHVRATSRGKMDAKGTDEASWAVDRRVDIELATR